jgi:hypothetical protein
MLCATSKSWIRAKYIHLVQLLKAQFMAKREQIENELNSSELCLSIYSTLHSKSPRGYEDDKFVILTLQTLTTNYLLGTIFPILLD